MKNKGYTMVELIVAMTVAAFVSIGLVTLFSLTFKQYKNTQLESQIQIEAQSVSEVMKPIFMGCSAYKKTIVELTDHTIANIVEIKTKSQLTKQDGYYYLIIIPTEKNCYLQFYTDKIDDLTNITYSNNDFLGQYIDDILLTPNEYDYETIVTNPDNVFDYHIDITYCFSESNITYSPSQIITLKSH